MRVVQTCGGDVQDVRAVWKWAAGIIASLMVVGLVYVASTITTLSLQVAVMQSDISHLRTEVRAGTADRYTGTQAATAERTRDRQIARLEHRLDAINARIMSAHQNKGSGVGQ